MEELRRMKTKREIKQKQEEIEADLKGTMSRRLRNMLEGWKDSLEWVAE